MYAKNVKHGDVKAENLLVYAYPDRLISKLCDFGFARQSSATMSVAGGGTANFEAPEVRATGKASFASDIFSIGMTAVQILTRKAPARHEWRNQVQRAVSGIPIPRGLSKEVFEAASSALQALLLRAVEEEQIRRPNAIEAAKSVISIFESLGGDPRTDTSAPDHDEIEIVENRVRQAMKQRVAGQHP